MMDGMIEVTKKEKPSNDATIKNIIIKNYSLDFKKNLFINIPAPEPYSDSNIPRR